MRASPPSVILSPAMRPSPLAVILRPAAGGPKNPIPPEALLCHPLFLALVVVRAGLAPAREQPRLIFEKAKNENSGNRYFRPRNLAATILTALRPPSTGRLAATRPGEAVPRRRTCSVALGSSQGIRLQFQATLRHHRVVSAA
jgi:hypothetical protein